MPDQEKIDNLPRKMSLSPAERKIIEAHRAKTVADRGFNAGLDHALECVPQIPDVAGGYTMDEVFSLVSTMKFNIEKARRDV